MNLFRQATNTCRRLSTVPHSSPHHNSLATFLAYAERTGLSSTSPLYVGTLYEYTVAQSLSRFSLALVRVGGRSDFGIDLLGCWRLPSSSPPFRKIPVLVQCKALMGAGKRRVGPNVVREMEGALASAPRRWRKEDVNGGALGVVVGTMSATRGVLEAIQRSRWPLAWIMCEKEGRVGQIVWNRRAEDLGLGGVSIETRYLPDREEKENKVKENLVLLWQNEEIKPAVVDADVADLEETLSEENQDSVS